MVNYFYDSNQVRYKLTKQLEGEPFNWLFIPGGPGADSTYFLSLIQFLELPGNIWLIDFPASGSHQAATCMNYDFEKWFEIFLPTISQFDNTILVGHSFGGMFPLLFPELEKMLKGFLIFNSAPKLWLKEAVAYAKQFDLPDISEEMARFTTSPSQETFEKALNACMPYYFPKNSLPQGRKLLHNVPFRFEPAVWWQRRALEINFSAKWIPLNVPTAIVGGKYDCICPFSLFRNDPRFLRDNISFHYAENAGHIGWIESPEIYIKAFHQLLDQL